MNIKICVKEGAKAPLYASVGAAGADVSAHLSQEVIIAAGSRMLIPTGIFFEIPLGYEIQVRPRSGLALKQGITVLNSPGTIDSDYRGELFVLLMNHGKHDFVVEPGMRIAQIVVAKCERVEFNQEEVLSASERGSGAFGHTGIL